MKRTVAQIMGRASKLGVYVRRWSEEDTALIREWFPKLGYKCISKLSRDAQGRDLHDKVRRMGLGGHVLKGKPYTEDEINLLLKYYPLEGKACYKRFNNRTRESVFSKAQQLNIKFVPKLRKIICIETNTVFDSINQAALLTNISYGNITCCLKARSKTAGGYHWKYVEEEENKESD